MKTAMCGVWHVHAGGYMESALKLTEVVGVWDENKDALDKFCAHFHLKAFASFEELLESEADSVLVCTATNLHTEVLVRLAEAGKNIFTEKVMTLTDEDAKKVADAVKHSGVKFVISFPHRYTAGSLTVKHIIDSGELGKINYMRLRNCHSGSVDNWLPDHFYDRTQCGGGAMIDLGAHGMYLTDWICGEPDTYASAFGLSCEDEKVYNVRNDRVEDNAVTMMGYKNGCVALNETGFVSRGYPMILEVGGEKGFVRFESNAGVSKCTKSTDMKLVSVALCDAQPAPVEQFLTGNILEGCGIEEAVRLTHMMVCAYKNII